MAQSITGTDLATTWAAKSSQVCIRVRASWNRDGDFSDAYEDFTDRVLSLTIDHSLYDQLVGLPLLGTTKPSTAQLQVMNEDRWFSPDNTSGLRGTYSNLQYGIYRIPVMIEMGYVGLDGQPDYLVQFVGEIESADESESYGTAVVNMSCIDKAIGLLQDKRSTTVTTNVRPDTYISTLLGLAGVTTHSLDVAMTEIPYAWIDDENIYDECRKLAASEGGMFYLSKDGIPQFRRMTALLERAHSLTPQATLNQGNAMAYRNSIAWRDAYTGVIVEWAGRYLGSIVELYKAPRPIAVPPNTTVIEEAKYRYPALYVGTPVPDTDYTVLTGALNKVPYGSYTLYGEMLAQHAVLWFHNNLSYDTVYICDLVVRGTPLIGEEAQERRWEQSAGVLPGSKDYRVRGNPYIQTEAQVARVGGYLRDRLQRPRRLLQWRGPACPWLELLDRVTLSHNTIIPNPGVNLDCYVVGNQMTYRADGMWEQQLTLLPVDELYAYSKYFTLGVSSYADTSSDRVAY